MKNGELKMKKFITVLLIVAMVLGMTACGKTESGNNGGGNGDTSAKAEEVGIWAYETLEIDLAKFNEGLSEEEQMTEDDLVMMRSFYDAFLAGMYFEFKEDGTGVLGYIAEDEENEMEPTEFKYANGKLEIPEEESQGFNQYEIRDGKLVFNMDDEEVKGMTLVMKKVESLDEVKANMEEVMKALEELFSTEE